MSLDQAVWLLLFVAIIFANIPWLLSNRLFIFVKLQTKPIWLNIIEWGTYFLLVGGLAIWLEYITMGNVAPQEWEFYVTGLFLFMIFAFPGFVYRYNLKMYLDRRNKRNLK